MAPSTKIQPIRQGLDQEALLKMIEPLTVHVVRLQGNARENIPMFPREGYPASGVGWTIAEVKEIDQEILRISGGGTYEVQVSDATQPVPETTKWGFLLPTNVYQMTPPITMSPTGTGPSMPPYQSPVMLHQPSPYSTTAPGYSGQAYNGQGGYPSQVNYGLHGYGPPPGSPPWGWSGSLPPAATSMIPTPLRGGQPDLQEALHRQQLGSQEERHRHEREMAAIQQQLMAVTAAPKHDTRIDQERVERERADRDRMERQLVEERARFAAAEERRAAEDRARLEREASQRQEAERQRQVDENARRLEAAMVEDRRRTDDKFATLMAQMAQQAAAAQAAIAAQPRGPDPLLMMLIETNKANADTARESARINAEAARETARLQADVAKEEARAQVEVARVNAESQQRLVTTVQSMMAPNQMSPMEAARVVQEAARSAESGSSAAMRSMVEMLGIQREFTSSMLQMAPQGEGIAGKVVDGIQDAIKTYTQGQAQVASAQAHAAAQVAQAQYRGPAAPLAPDAGLAGTPQPGAVTVPPSAQALSTSPTPTTQPSDEPLRSGKTDQQWFGPGLPDVLNLRQGVAVYLAGVEADNAELAQPDNEPLTIIDPATNKPLGISPLLAARIVTIAAAAVRDNKIPGVEAFTYLYEQGMFPALLDVALPDAPQAYRVDVLRFLNRLLTGSPLAPIGDEPMYGIAPFLGPDGEPDGVEVPEGLPVAPPVVVRSVTSPAPQKYGHQARNGRGR